jgi:hypothetical protein
LRGLIFAAQNSYCNSREDSASAEKGKKQKNKDLAAKKLIHELLGLEKNPDLEEKGGTMN